MINVGFKLGISNRKKGFERYSEAIRDSYFVLDVSRLNVNKLK